jgi:hypothetical protein
VALPANREIGVPRKKAKAGGRKGRRYRTALGRCAPDWRSQEMLLVPGEGDEVSIGVPHDEGAGAPRFGFQCLI